MHQKVSTNKHVHRKLDLWGGVEALLIYCKEFQIIQSGLKLVFKKNPVKVQSKCEVTAQILKSKPQNPCLN